MKIICVGRNYAEHVAELNNEIESDPILFIKPDSAVLQKRNPFYIPDFSKDVHHEVELVLKIKKTGKHIQERFAKKYFDEIGLGIDFTARDIQLECKKKGLPWEKAKAFDGSCVVGQFIPISEIENINNISFRLDKNGKEIQTGNSNEMIHSFDKLLVEISKYFTLKIGDLVFTGTPAGVGPVIAGDKLEGYIEDWKSFSINIK